MNREEVKVLKNFMESMRIELDNNTHKGSILHFTDFNSIITELEYHKAKMFLAIRCKDKRALREYIADVANNLLALGNSFDLYSKDIIEDNIVCELNIEDTVIRHKDKEFKKINQKLI